MGYFSQGMESPRPVVGNKTPQFQDVSSAARAAEANDPLRRALGSAGDLADIQREKAEKEEEDRKAALIAKGIDPAAQPKEAGFFSKLFGG